MLACAAGHSFSGEQPGKIAGISAPFLERNAFCWADDEADSAASASASASAAASASVSASASAPPVEVVATEKATPTILTEPAARTAPAAPATPAALAMTIPPAIPAELVSPIATPSSRKPAVYYWEPTASITPAQPEDDAWIDAVSRTGIKILAALAQQALGQHLRDEEKGGFEQIKLSDGGFKRRRLTTEKWQYFCHHGTDKRRCKLCGGSALCVHGRQKFSCKRVSLGRRHVPVASEPHRLPPTYRKVDPPAPFTPAPLTPYPSVAKLQRRARTAANAAAALTVVAWRSASTKSGAIIAAFAKRQR